MRINEPEEKRKRDWSIDVHEEGKGERERNWCIKPRQFRRMWWQTITFCHILFDLNTFIL